MRHRGSTTQPPPPPKLVKGLSSLQYRVTRANLPKLHPLLASVHNGPLVLCVTGAGERKADQNPGIWLDP